MLDQLRAWLNGARDYQKGVALYFVVGDNLQHRGLFIKGKTDFTYKLLQDELMSICLKMKGEGQPEPPAAPVITEPANPDLYEACRQEALLEHKKAMNPRAILFRMAEQALTSIDPNTQEMILSRKDLAFDVVNNYNVASALFDRADYVKVHGKLPEDAASEPQAENNPVHDVMVFYALCNCRKYYNKLKAKPENSKRVAMMQEYQAQIKQLEDRWQLLKQEHEK